MFRKVIAGMMSVVLFMIFTLLCSVADSDSVTAKVKIQFNMRSEPKLRSKENPKCQEGSKVKVFSLVDDEWAFIEAAKKTGYGKVEWLAISKSDLEYLRSRAEESHPVDDESNAVH